MKDREATPDNGKLWQLEKRLEYSYMRAALDEKGNRIEHGKQDEPPPPNADTKHGTFK